MQVMKIHLLVVLGAVAGCIEGVEDPIGPAWLEIAGGFCNGPCSGAVVYRDGDEVQLHQRNGAGAVTYEATGTLTPAGLDEFRAASAEVSAVLPQSFASCAAADGQDILVTLDDGEMQWDEQFCATRDPEAPLIRVDAFLDGVLDALRRCESNEHVDVHGC